MTTVVCYISGHGFGHAVRVAAVLEAVWARRPEIVAVIRTPAPRWIFDFNLSGPFTHSECRLDVGAVQPDSLTVDPEKSLRAYAALAARASELIAHEVAVIAPHRPALVFGDIPALAFDIAAELGVPAVAMTNFSWDWIYADYVRDFPRYASLIDDIRVSYGRADLLLRLPFHGDLSAFRNIRDVPLVTRTAVLSRSEVFRRLGLPAAQRLVLLSFGGIGISLRPPPAIPGVTFIVTEAGSVDTDGACRLVSIADLGAATVRHEDLVAACDAVMTKPGYGIVAECIATATPIVYTSRGCFAEYACLVEGIEAHLPHAFISHEDLHAGRWMPALEHVFAQPRCQPRISTNGATVAADALIQRATA